MNRLRDPAMDGAACSRLPLVPAVQGQRLRRDLDRAGGAGREEQLQYRMRNAAWRPGRTVSGLRRQMRSSMSNEQRDGLYLVLMGSLVFILMGTVLQRAVPAPLADFGTIYFPSKALIEQRDPFKPGEVTRIYEAQRDSRAPETPKDRQIATQNVYPPNTLFLAVPFAALPLKPAGILWSIVTLACFITASLLVWNLGADYAPALSGALVGFLLAASELLPMTGNVAGIAIGLCAIAVWCFVRERLVALGILCLAVSLVLKPHDTGLVWLYFLLAGSIQRKRALKTLLVALVLSLPWPAMGLARGAAVDP